MFTAILARKLYSSRLPVGARCRVVKALAKNNVLCSFFDAKTAQRPNNKSKVIVVQIKFTLQLSAFYFCELYLNQ